jgi:hypothetical protein
MLVVVCVPLTLLATCATRLEACLDEAARNCRCELGLPAQNPAGGDADIAAVLARSDAAHLVLDVRLSQAAVGARRATLRAVEARIDARDECGGVHLHRTRVRFQHLLSVGHLYLLLALPLDETSFRGKSETITRAADR